MYLSIALYYRWWEKTEVVWTGHPIKEAFLKVVVRYVIKYQYISLFYITTTLEAFYVVIVTIGQLPRVSGKDPERNRVDFSF